MTTINNYRHNIGLLFVFNFLIFFSTDLIFSFKNEPFQVLNIPHLTTLNF